MGDLRTPLTGILAYNFIGQGGKTQEPSAIWAAALG